jgi:putative transposase
MLEDRLGVSERRACRIVGQHRSTHRRVAVRAGYDDALRGRLREISRERPRWGYRRAHALLLEEGWEINRKRVQRLWREEGLRVPRRRRKRQRLGDSTVEARYLRAERPDHVWALDYQFDQTADGRILKALHVVDEFTREALAMECRRRIDADATVEVLDRLVAARGGAPEFIRCDNGPELTAHALKDWCRLGRTGSAYIEPGSPWENPFVESFNARVRDELLTVELFSCLAEAQVLVEAWRCDYNQHHPHSALGMKTPARFAQAWRENPENTRLIIPGAPAEDRRTPQNAPVDTDITENRADPAPGAPAPRPAVPELPSPSRLTPLNGDTTTLQPTNHQRLSLQVDR